MTTTNKKVAVALSGGLDSSVACALLLQQGYEVVGITAKMTNSEGSEIVCKNAQKVAQKLGIEHFVLDLTQDFQKFVINYFENAYKCAITPNPCIVCNQKIKWGKVFDYAINDLKCDFIATGHYAKIEQKNGKFLLFPAEDEQKDQLYYLIGLTQEHLSKTIFPLSDYKKTQIREMAQTLDLPSKSAKESQDICFIEKPMTTKKWLFAKFGQKMGDFVLKKSMLKMGQHNGCFQYTIGQRKGIGIAYSEPLYVTEIDAEKNQVFLGTKEELFGAKCEIENLNIQDELPQNGVVMAKIRYNMPQFKAKIVQENGNYILFFDTEQSAITKGQVCALYDINDGHLLAGGWIK